MTPSLQLRLVYQIICLSLSQKRRSTISRQNAVLRSSDNVDFHTHKLLLSLISPIFAPMFTLPQTSIEPKEGVTTEAGLPIIPLTEDSEVLGKLLTWCDPRCLIAMDEQVDIRIALQLVDKYDIDTVAIRAREALRRLSTSSVRQEPMSMYALACKHGFQDIALCTAKAALRLKLSEFPYVPQLKNVSGAAIYRLYDYHLACRLAVVPLVDNLGRRNDSRGSRTVLSITNIRLRTV